MNYSKNIITQLIDQPADRAGEENSQNDAQRQIQSEFFVKEKGGVAADSRQRAVAEVKKLNRAVNQIKTDRDQGVNRAGDDAVNDQLRQDGHLFTDVQLIHLDQKHWRVDFMINNVVDLAGNAVNIFCLVQTSLHVRASSGAGDNHIGNVITKGGGEIGRLIEGVRVQFFEFKIIVK